MISSVHIRKYKKQVRSGLPEGEVKQQMLAEGFTEEDIQQVFAPVTERDMQSWYILSTLISLFFGIGLINKQPILFSPFCFLLAAFCVYNLIMPNTRVLR
jgi:hypothetical protein